MTAGQSEESIWNQRLAARGIDPKALLHASPWDTARRVYAQDDLIHKVTLKGEFSRKTERMANSAEEFAMLSRLAGLRGFPEPISYISDEWMDCLTLRRIRGQTLEQSRLGWLTFLQALAAAMLLVLRQAWRGISHNDISIDNILSGVDGRVWLLDYDQACRANFPSALLRDFFGITVGNVTVRGSLLFTFRQYVRKRRVTLPGLNLVATSHDLVRRFVLVTRGNRLLGNVYSRLYSIAFGLAVRWLSTDRRVVALLLRSGGEPGGWRPGLSDFDFTVLITDMDTTVRLAFLDTFWKRYTRIRRLIPMVTEVDVLCQSEFVAAHRLSRGPMMSDKTFVRAGGSDDIEIADFLTHANAVMDETDRFRDALIRYEYFTCPHVLNRRTALADHRLKHHLQKLQQLCAPGQSRVSDFAGIFQLMVKFCKSYTPHGGDSLQVHPQENHLNSMTKKTICTSGLSDGMRFVCWEPWGGGDTCSIALVVPDDVSPERLEHARILARQMPDEIDGDIQLLNDPMHFGYGPYTVLLLSESMWRCRLALFPLESAAILPPHTPPSRSSLYRYAALQYGVWLSSRNDWVKEQDWRKRFCALICRAQQLAGAIRTGILQTRDDHVHQCNDCSRWEIYERSSEVLGSLGKELRLHR